MIAMIRWLSEQEGGRREPPSGEGPMPSMPIIRFVDEPWPGEVAWSLKVYKREAEHDPDRWLADVAFLVEEAPRESLREGREFELHEGGRCVARGGLIAASQATTANAAWDAAAF